MKKDENSYIYHWMAINDIPQLKNLVDNPTKVDFSYKGKIYCMKWELDCDKEGFPKRSASKDAYYLFKTDKNSWEIFNKNRTEVVIFKATAM